jgi:hypothetical protein
VTPDENGTTDENGQPDDPSVDETANPDQNEETDDDTLLKRNLSPVMKKRPKMFSGRFLNLQ